MWSKPTQPINTNSPPAAEPLSPTSIKKKNPGRRYAQMIKLKPDCVDKYKELHAAIWPEVLKQIKASNIQDCECLSTSLLPSRAQPHTAPLPRPSPSS